MSETPQQDTDAQFNARAAEAARRQAENSEQDPKLRITKRGKAFVAIASTALTLGVGVTAANAIAEPTPSFTQSEESSGYTAPEGGSTWDALQYIEGADKVNSSELVDSIHNNPANVEVLKDGLQVGETISIPVSVEPK